MPPTRRRCGLRGFVAGVARSYRGWGNPERRLRTPQEGAMPPTLGRCGLRGFVAGMARSYMRTRGFVAGMARSYRGWGNPERSSRTP